MAKNIAVEARFIYSVVNRLLRKAGTVLGIKMSGEMVSYGRQKPPRTAFPEPRYPCVMSSCVITNPNAG